MVPAAFTIAGFTLVSRLLGLGRDVLFAYAFGAGRAWDVFVIALTVPNLFRQLFGEGALTSALLPAFVGKDRVSRSDATRLLNAVLGWVCVILGGVAAAGMVLTLLSEPWLPDEKARWISAALRWTLPYAPMICATALMGAALNGVGRFAISAFSPVLFNLLLIAGALSATLVEGEWERVRCLCGALLVAGLVQVAIHLPALRSQGVAVSPSVFPSEWRGSGLSAVVSAFFPAALAGALVQVNELLDLLVAEICIPGDGAVGALYYANRLQQLPLGVVGFSIATAAFPLLSRAAAGEGRVELRRQAERAMRLAWLLAVPSAVGLAALAPQIVSGIFERGRFGPEEVSRTAFLVLLYALGTPFALVNMVLTRTIQATGDTRSPAGIALAGVALNAALNLTLVWPLAEGGIVLATAVTAAVNFHCLRRTAEGIVGGPIAGEAGWRMRVWVASGFAGVAASAGAGLAGGAGPLVSLGLGVAGAIIVFLIAAAGLGIPDVREGLPSIVFRRRYCGGRNAGRRGGSER